MSFESPQQNEMMMLKNSMCIGFGFLSQPNKKKFKTFEMMNDYIDCFEKKQREQQRDGKWLF